MSRLESFVELLNGIAEDNVLVRLCHKLDELPDYILEGIVENIQTNEQHE